MPAKRPKGVSGRELAGLLGALWVQPAAVCSYRARGGPGPAWHKRQPIMHRGLWVADSELTNLQSGLIAT
jgi:hypothetical protein